MSKEKIIWKEEQKESCGEIIVLSIYSVMHSAAGHYVGRFCKTVGGQFDGFIEPYDRLTDYMTYTQAVNTLKSLNN